MGRVTPAFGKSASEANQSRQPASPPVVRLGVRPRWRDPRLAGGIALVALSVFLGSHVVASADDRVSVWAASHDLAAGSQLRAEDLVEVSVRLEDASTYLATQSKDLVGRRVSRAIGDRELIASTAVAIGTADSRLVSIPVEPLHCPPNLQHGDRVDIYVSAREAAGQSAAGHLVLANALVAEAGLGDDSASGEIAVVLDVAPMQVAPVVGASRTGVIDLVRIPVGAQ